ncbi:hypothetical protein [Erythrobacter sp. BLCC-B19]|uniref:hypothetical protein n=1 Tax=Erythrobacter sp. BLCC-B19 TaxID=3025315 RepID=UPI0023618F06|nr:hypothetical protein [Erythrobacter sp. BLCC-B19]WDA39951.1 hypothetical protein PS060_10265 [Erythrobacter sp. BLCC-B19]
MMNRSQARSLGWAAVLAVCLAMLVVLSFKVHAVKSEVLLAERTLIALERETMLLETEFQTRANQRQLAEWNAVEFGYAAPRAGQFLDGERQLASLGEQLGPDAPAPIRLARADASDAAAAAEDAPMRSPVSGAKVAMARAEPEKASGEVFAEAFGDFLIEASPIRPARAETPKTLPVKGTAE